MSDDVTKALHKSQGFGMSGGQASGPLKERFVYPPFSVWNTRDEYWIKRRRLWLGLGIESEVGRADKLTFKFPEKFKSGQDCQKIKAQTSVFDPVVCELAMRWWSPAGGVVVDPFAGGSVRGIVAACLGRRYWGCELRGEQVEANNVQRGILKDTIRGMAPGAAAPVWVQGDSTTKLADSPEADMLFTCPPYGNLEIYSEDPADISNKPTGAFLDAYGAILQAAADRLRDDRFAVIVVGNYRDKVAKGSPFIDLVGHTNRLCEAAGLRYYNDIIIVNSVGTGAMRSELNFVRGSRKVVKTHQNVMVYVKGDERRAAEHIKTSKNFKE
jgi:DNA modification methylase